MSAAAALAPSGSVVPSSTFTFEQAQERIDAAREWLLSPETMKLPLDEVERGHEVRIREAARLQLQAHIRARGLGDVGPALTLVGPQGPPVEEPYTHRRVGVRHLETIFGEVEVARVGYGTPGAESLHPLDQELRLPERSYSYEVQHRLVKAAAQQPFDEAVERLREATGVDVPKRSVEQVVREAAEDFDAFYGSRPIPPPETTAPIVVGAIDGKGIPMVKPEAALRVVRRGKGEKANKKRMATVAAVYTIAPNVRTAEDVVESLFRTGPRLPDAEDRPPRARPEHKRVWASLERSKDEVIQEAAAEMVRRDPRREKTHAVLTDGERALQDRVTKFLPGVRLILDLIHVMEYLWLAAYVFHAEGSTEALEWVKERALRILHGGVSQVVKGLRQSATKRRLRGPAAKTVLRVAAYLYRNRARMRYDEYLAAGLPIASGAVEGACRHLIKDRMERSGMRWTIAGAEAMVRLRATYVSDDFEEYWQFHVKHDQERIHPPGHWRPVVAK